MKSFIKISGNSADITQNIFNVLVNRENIEQNL